MSDAAVFKTISQLGWRWHDGGVVLWVTIDGRQRSVWVPMSRVFLTFDSEMSKVGCPLPTSVGAAYSRVGFFGAIKRAVRKVHRKVKKALPKSVRRAAGRIQRQAQKAWKVGQQIGKGAYRVFTSREAQAVMAGLGVAVPVLAPAAASVLAAQEALRHIDTGTKVAKAVVRGFKSPQAARQMAQGLAAKRLVSAQVAKANQGDVSARRFMGALAQFAA